jgi:hypothetical protein
MSTLGHLGIKRFELNVTDQGYSVTFVCISPDVSFAIKGRVTMLPSMYL